MMPHAPLDGRLPGAAEAEGRLRWRPAHALGVRLATALAVAGILTCDGGTEPPVNQAPQAVGTIPDQVVEVDSTVAVDVAAYFSDPEGDPLTYAAMSSNATTAAVMVSESTVTVTGVAAGSAMVTVTARDPAGLTAEQTFGVTVPNRAPGAVGTIPDAEVFVDSVTEVDVAAYFTDPDGDDLDYLAASSDTALAAVAVSGSTVTVTGVAVGSVTVTVTAQDTGGLSAGQSFGVTVPNRSPGAVGTIADREVEVDSVLVLDVEEYFADPDGQELEYSLASSDTTRVAVAVSGSEVTIAGAAAGSATVTVTATDPGGLSAEQSFVVAVPNRSPRTVGTITDRDLYVGDTIEFDAAQHFSDPDGDTLAFAATSSDATLVAVSVSGSAVTLAGMAVGSVTVTVTAMDPEGLSAEQEFAVTVPNRPPEPVGTLADRDVFVGDSVTVDVAANFLEPDGQELEYAAATTSAATATVAVSGSAVTVTGVMVGVTTVTVSAQDPLGLWAEQNFVVTVPNRAPETVGSIGDREVEVNSIVTLSVAEHFRDPDGQALDYSAASSDTGRVAVAVSGNVVIVLGIRAGHATVTVTATDPGGLMAEQSFAVTVPNRPPRPVGTIAERDVYVGGTIEFDVAAHFRDPDGDTLAYTATSLDSSLVAVSVSGSAVTLTGLAVGSVTVTVTAMDPEGLAAEQEFAVTVPNRPPEAVGTLADREVFVGDSVTVDVAASFAEPDGQELEYAVATSNEAVASVAALGSAVTVTGVAVGATTVTVSAQDPLGLWAEQNFVVTVPNRAPERVGSIGDREVAVDSVVTLGVAAHFTDPDGQVLDFSVASSDTTRVAVTVAGNVVTVAGVRAGHAMVTVVATDPGGLMAEQSFAVRVPNRPPRPVGMIAERDVYVGDTIEIDAAQHFRDPDEDMLAYTATSLDATLVAVSVSGSAVTLTGIAVGSVTVTVTATDPEGLDAEQGFTVTVPNRPPEPVGTVADQQVFVGNSVTVNVAANFLEPDGQELEYAVATSNAAVASVAASGSAVTVTGVAVGAAMVTVTVQDPGGLEAEQNFTVTVPSRAPEPVGGIGDREVKVDSVLTLDVSASFTEPDGEALEYSFSSSDTTRVVVAGEGSVLNVRGVGAGQATVTVVATDPGGLAAEQNFGVRVPSRPPVAVGTIDDRVVPAGTTEAVDVAEYFADPDGDALGYFARSSDTTRVRAMEQGQVVTLHGVAGGSATVTVTARDPEGLTAEQTFGVTVPNRAPQAVRVIENATVDVGNSASLDVSAHFSDPDGDDLAYTGTSSDAATAAVSVSGSTITVTGVSAGVATITATARDPGGLSAVQSFDVTVLQPNRAPVVVRQITDLDALAGERYAASLVGVFEDPDDDPLTYTVSSSNSAIANPEIRDDSVFISAVGVGSANVSVTATDPEGLSATETFGVTVADHSSFDMLLGFTPAVTEAQRVRIRAARDAWESVVRWTELNDVRVPNPECLNLVRRTVVTVDDHLAMLHVDSIDGPGGILAFAGYCIIRRSDGTPVVSATWFDEADIDRVMSLGMLGTLAFHEFAHGLGFVRRYWDDHGLLDTVPEPHFKGRLAIDAFDAAGGAGHSGAKVPVSSPDYSHWREDVFGREGMTPALTLGVANPFSAITLQAMADVGYLVDVSLADDYQLPNTAPPDLAADMAGQVLDLSNDVVHGPIMVLDSDGRVLRVIPAPPGSPAPSFDRHEVQIELRGPNGARDGGLTLAPPAGAPMWRLVRPSPRRPPR